MGLYGFRKLVILFKLCSDFRVYKNHITSNFGQHRAHILYKVCISIIIFYKLVNISH